MSNSNDTQTQTPERDITQVERIIGSSNVAIGTGACIQSYNYNYGRDPKRRLQTMLQEPENYISRPTEEERLSELLKSVNGPTPILISAMSGAGKTWLLTKVLAQLQQGDTPLFTGGFLWASMANLEVHELLQECLDLSESTTEHAHSGQSSVRKLFWNHFTERPGRSLIIFDDIHQERQLHQLLPDPRQALNNCCIVVLCSQQVNYAGMLQSNYSLQLSSMKEEEIYSLFQLYLNISEKHMRLQRRHFEDIANRVGSLPLLLTTAANDMKIRGIPPSAYAYTLRELDNPNTYSRRTIINRLELVLHDLSTDQLDLFTFIGVLGEGPWRQEMLAAVAIRHPTDIQADLNALIKRGLIQTYDDRRYQVNVITRELAQQLLHKQSAYIQHAAYVCLAHECLNYARYITMLVSKEPQVQKSIITTEASHIRQVITWAIQHQEWHLLLQFADVATHEQLSSFVVGNFDEIKVNLMLATLIEPIVCPGSNRYNHSSYIFAGTNNWYYKVSEKNQEMDKGSLPELGLNIQLGQIIDGLFEDSCLLYSHWVGVRAIGLICRRLNMIGCELIACDLSNSIWLDIEAPQINLSGSLLNGAFLEKVRLYRAILKDANLSNTVFMQVKLQGADLSYCNLTNTLFDDVDLRGANMRGARVDGAVFHRVQFQGCLAEGVDWKTANIVDPTPTQEESDEIAVALGPEAQQRIISKLPETPRQKHQAMLASISRSVYEHGQPKLEDLTFTRPDFRAFSYSNTSKTLMASKCKFLHADFRAAYISHADFSETDWYDSDLRRTSLEDVSFRKANLRGADLRSAILKNVSLEDADLTNARLGYIEVEGSNLQRVCLRGAQLRHASLVAAQLQQADLVDADLSYAKLDQANLEKANLSRANLKHASLVGGHLSEANLEGAICDEADFINAIISDEQLACASSWHNAILPNGNKILDIPNQEILLRLLEQQNSLRLAYLIGEFENIQLENYDMFGTQLSGDFSQVNFQRTKLEYAHLSGYFSEIDCTKSFLSKAILSGIFVKTTFDGCVIIESKLSGIFSNCSFYQSNLQNASFDSVSLSSCDFTDAQLDEELLGTAFRLRGSTLPNGSVYDGRFNLIGDKEDALRFGYDLEISEQRSTFYSRGRLKPRFNKA